MQTRDRGAADADGKIPLVNGYKLLRKFNSEVTYAGMTAREFLDRKKITLEDWKAIHRDYATSMKEVGPDVSYFWIFSALLGGVVLLIFGESWWRWIGVPLVLFAVSQFGEIEGHKDGYMAGYSSGFEDGFDRALGVTPEESADAATRATQMDADDLVIAALERTAAEPERKEG